MLEFLVLIVALLAASGALGVIRALDPRRPLLVYGIALVLCLGGLAVVLGHRVMGAPVLRLVLPLGLPWVGVHLRLDALAGFFCS